jgi:hypothetical protein
MSDTRDASPTPVLIHGKVIVIDGYALGNMVILIIAAIGVYLVVTGLLEMRDSLKAAAHTTTIQ